MSLENNLPLNQFINVVISDDRLSARLQLIHDDAKFQCTAGDLEELLKQNGIKYGIQFDILDAIVTETRKFVYNQVTVAAGIPPKDGENGYIKYLFDLDGGKKPAILEDGKVDYKEVVSLNNVRKGQLIAERVPATDGTEGRAVTGEPLSGNPGKEARFKIGKNVVVDQDQMLMYAAMDGLVTTTEKDKINVFPIYEVNGDVDYNIGNIDFVGTVLIRGNVLSGFRIRAAGDIRVTGGVEGSELFAEGSIEISAGIHGHNKGLIKAKRNVKCSFIQEGNVEAGEDIIVTQSVMHSNIRAAKNVICLGSKGLIVGGVVQAGETVKARVVGNSTSTATILEVGVLPELRNELSKLRAKVKEFTENTDKTDKALALLDQLALSGQLSQDKLAMRSRLNTSKRQSIDALSEMRERILDIEKSLEDTAASRIEVSNTIYAGCKIVIGRYTRFVKDATKHVIFRMVDGEIVMQSKL